MRKNKGFTLIELLAVIVIMAVIAVIATPLIISVIEKAQASAYKESLRGIFGATDLYIASEGFNGFPDDGINVTDTNIKMKNKNFTSGKIIKNNEGNLELEKISDGLYCGSGTLNNLIITKGSCDNQDMTPPTINVNSSLITSNSITIVANAVDEESGISGYQYSKDNGLTWTQNQVSNIYTFTGLTNNASYTFKVRAFNNNSLFEDSTELIVSTNNIEVPTYAINPTGWTQGAIVTITYPAREISYIYEYSLDEGVSWEEVTSPDVTKDITFTDNGSVIARVSDGTNIVSGTTYQVTNVDNEAPIISANPTTVTVSLGSSYTDSGVIANDNTMGDITSDIITTGTVNTSIPGIYTLTYNVTDLAGNVATEVVRTIHVIQTVYTFDYTGSAQTLTVPMTGNYKLETWGAQGGKSGGNGAYAQGVINLTADSNLYVYVGGAGKVPAYNCQSSQVPTQGPAGGYNGGGYGGGAFWCSAYAGGSGGGATDIRLNGSTLNDRIIVAGGGGGAGTRCDTCSDNVSGGYGGGITSGANGMGVYRGMGATATAGGAGNTGTSTPGGSGGFGYGGNGAYNTTNIWNNYGGGGGGGGWYGGGAAANINNNWSGHTGGGGGGTSYVGSLQNAQAIAGNASMPNPSGGTETGHIGNGYAKITFISQ